MGADTSTLTLFHWLSPAFPTGAFAYSHGLETAVAQGWIQDAAGLTAWLTDLLSDGTLRSDAVWLCLAARAADTAALEALNQEARAFAGSACRRREGDRQGAAFADSVSAVWPVTIPPVQMPLAVGYAARQMQFSPGAVAELYTLAFVSNLVAAAQRLMPLGQCAGQAIIADLTPLCAETGRWAAQQTDQSAIASQCYLSDIAAMQHEMFEPKVFQS